MNVLVITGHPRPASFCAALAADYAAGAREAGCAVRELSLDQLDFDPDVHSVSPLQQPLEPDLDAVLTALEWASHIALFYPSWWGYGPARLKGLFDRVLLPGRAFREAPGGQLEGLMRGRTAHLLTTLDMSPWVYRWIYRAGGLQALRRSTLGVCGIRCTRTLCIGPVNHADATRRDAWRHEARRLGQALAAGPLRPHQRVADALVAWLRAMRLQFFPMSWLAYTLGALAAAQAGRPWDSAAYALGYAVLFFVKLGTVFSNEYHDFESDRINRNAGAFNGGSRVLVDGSLRAAQLRMATLLVLSAAGLCAMLAMLRDPSPASATVLMVSAVASLGYTMPPLRLSWRGWGELDVALTHSIGVILWGYVLQGADWSDAAPWALSLPLALSILPAILLSSIPDAAADRQAGKRTLAVRHGEQAARALAAACAAAAVGAAWWIDTLGVTAGSGYMATLPWIALHLLALLALLVVARAPQQAAIVCALAYLMWFVGTPLWALIA